MNRLPHIAIFFAAVLLLAADEKDEKTKESVPSAAQVQRWIKQLGDESFKVREEATRDLIQAGRVALDAVTKATKSKDPEIKQRALMIIKHIDGKAEQQRLAVETIRMYGGRVYYDYQIDENGEKIPKKKQQLPCTPQQRKQFGIDFFADVVWVECSGGNYFIPDLGDYRLKDLVGMTKLKVLDLSRTQVTDAGMKHLAGMKNLEWLSLDDTQVTAEGVAKLRKAFPKCQIDWDGK